MKVTISISEELNKELETYIERRFGPGQPRIKSAIISAALRHYMHPLIDPWPNPNAKEPLPSDQTH